VEDGNSDAIAEAIKEDPAIFIATDLVIQRQQPVRELDKAIAKRITVFKRGY
jgi:hypothetical protein